MSTVTPKELLARLYRYFWTLIVILLILAAVLFTVVRLTLPYANAYRAEVEDSLTKTLGQKVTVQGMTAELFGIRPSLVLNGVTVYGASGKRELFRIASLVVGFSISKSFAEKHPIPVSLRVKGARLDITRDSAGKFRLNGVPLKLQPNKNGAQMPQYQPVLQWLFHHGRLGLEQVVLSYQDEASGLHLGFDNVQLHLKNSGARHQVDGILHLPEAWGQTAGFSIDVQAEDLHDSRNWKIATFLVAQELNLPEITKTFPIDGSVVEHGVGNLQLWSNWQGMEPKSLEANFSVLNLAYRPSRQSKLSFAAEAVNAHVIAQHQAAGVWNLNIPHLQIADHGGERDPIRLSLQLNQNTGDIDARANVIYLQDIRRMLIASGQVNASWLDALSGISPSGELRDLHLVYRLQSKTPDYTLAFRLKDVSIHAWKQVPKFSNLSGVVWLDPNSGVAEIDSRDMVVRIPKIFRQPWGINALKGNVQWRKLGGSWHIQTNRLDIDGVDADLTLSMHLMLPQGHPAYLDLLARFDQADLGQLPRYYPVSVMAPSLVEWLDRAIVSGRGVQGGILFHGPLKKHTFPFHHHEGNFEVALQGQNIELDYLKQWPALKHMNGDLLFDGPGMQITANSGTIEGMQISEFSAHVKDFRYPWLRLKGRVAGDTGKAVAFIAHSPLREHSEQVIDRLQASGQTDLDLGMSIPLNHRLGKIRYSGKLNFTDSRFRSRLGQGQIMADGVNGQLRFNERGYHAHGIQARVFQRPARISVTTQQEGGDRMVELMVRGRAPSSVLNNELKLGLFHYLNGETDFTARVQLISGSHYESRLLVDSQLQNMAIELPAPLGKPADQAEPISVHWELSHGQFGLHLGNDFQAALSLQDLGDRTELSRGELHFGAGEARTPEQDVLQLSGSLPQLPLKAWMHTLSGNGKGQDMTGNLPIQMRFDTVNVIAEPKQAALMQSQQKTPNDEPRKFDVSIRKLVYKDIDLGKLTLLAENNSSGYKIDVLSLDGPVLGLSSSGYWNQGRSEETALNFSFQAHSTEDLLSAFGFKTSIRGGDLSMHGNLQWPGSPGDFKLASFKGKASFHMSDGRLEDIDPGAGRVWGLFSFQALPRRLALDFRDLFGKGYRFDSIRGDIQVHDGNAYTHNTEISSPAARVNISGRTGLVTHDYDQDVIVNPIDGSNLFVAGALAGGLQTGVVVWLVQKLFNVEKYSRFIYKITGTWEHPIVTNLSEAEGKSSKGEKK